MSVLKHSWLTHFNAFDSAIIFAVILHAFFIISVTFRMPDETTTAAQHTLDVVLVNPVKEKVQPDKPDFLSSVSQDGGTEHTGDSRPSAPARASLLEETKTPATKLERSGTPEPQAPTNKQVATQKTSVTKVEHRSKKPPVQAPARTKVAQLLASTQQEITRLTAEIDRNRLYASDRPKRKAINASTKEYRYASYLTAWRKKVERIGNLNYPDEARRKKLHGNLLLHVAVRADGSLQKVRIVHSSGHQTLDDAAVRIVKLAAPFAPFPPEIRKETDIIDITRTWQFQRNNQLFTNK